MLNFFPILAETSTCIGIYYIQWKCDDDVTILIINYRIYECEYRMYHVPTLFKDVRELH